MQGERKKDMKENFKEKTKQYIHRDREYSGSKFNKLK